MGDLRTRLERIGRRIEPQPDAFERLERARRRRARNRRIEAGIVAFAVAIGGSLAAFAAFRDSEPRVGGAAEDGFFALWPEQTYEDALEGQWTVDQDLSGQLAWRLNPEATAEEFAREALGWGSDRPDDVHTRLLGDADVAGRGPVRVEISTPPFPCPPPGDPGCVRKTGSVTLARLVRPDGIWSVVEVGGDAFDLLVAPGERVEVGGSISVPTTLKEGTEVAVGVKGTGVCTGFHEQTAEVLDGHVVVPVEGVGEGCAGYLYALTPPTPVGQVELGRIMFVWGEPKPALGYTIESIAAVPVRFVAPSPYETPSVEPTAPHTLHITCDGSSIVTDLSMVRTEPNGVHVIVENTTDHSLSLVVLRGGEGPARAVQVEPGDVHLAYQLPPGAAAFYCADDSSPLAVETDTVDVEVRDDGNLFVPFDLECGGTTMRLAPTVAALPGVGSDAPDPLDLVRSLAQGLRPSDIVERAGYVDAVANPIVRVVRDGRIVATFDVFEGSHGWTADPASCPDSGIHIPDEWPNPNGWFEWCPEGPFLEPGEGWRQAASEVAERFASAYVVGDQATLDEVLDPSVPEGAELRVVLAEGVEPTVLDTGGDGGGIAEFSCGADVARHSVTAGIDDGTDSASADFIVYLVFRDDGWKVWGVY